MKKCMFCDMLNSDIAQYCIHCGRRFEKVEGPPNGDLPLTGQTEQAPTVPTPKPESASAPDSIEPEVEVGQSQPQESTAKKPKIYSCWTFILIALVLFLVLTNPSRESHNRKILTHIGQVAGQDLGQEMGRIIGGILGQTLGELTNIIDVNLFEYHNLLLFSTTTINGRMTSIGFFGNVFITVQDDEWDTLFQQRITSGNYTPTQNSIINGSLNDPRYIQNPTFVFPDAGEKNNNNQIGPFCCTGRTVTVRNLENEPIGYVYFYSWEGQAMTLSAENRSIAPDLKILVSSLADLNDPYSEQIEGYIAFSAEDMMNKPVRNTTVAGLNYTAKIIDVETLKYGEDVYFYMDSPVIQIDVIRAD